MSFFILDESALGQRAGGGVRAGAGGGVRAGAGGGVRAGAGAGVATELD